MSDDPTLPVVDPAGDAEGDADADAHAHAHARPVAADESVAGVLLAAGPGTRFSGGNKLLADLDGDPLVCHAARTLAAADLDPLVAVVGRDAGAVRDALSGFDFAFVENPDYAEGQSTSVRRAVEAIGDARAAVFALGDMPRVDSASVDALVSTYRTGRWSALAAACDARRGNPVLFDARHFAALSGVEGDTGGRDVLLSADDAALVETGDPGVLRDVDTRDDLEGLREG